MSSAPTWKQLRQAVGAIAKFEGSYVGLPMPAEEAALVVAPKHPCFERLNGVKLGTEKPASPNDMVLLNSWYCARDRRTVVVYRDTESAEKSRVGWLNQGPIARVAAQMKCLGIGLTMDIRAEEKAMDTLRSLIKPHLFDAYRLVGFFIETSKRSGVTYLFRRLGTTIAFRQDGDLTRFLAAMCLHPLAYYDGLPMGAMVPTDDVIAHLVMMRSDEHLFWKRSNQHAASSPGAML